MLGKDKDKETKADGADSPEVNSPASGETFRGKKDKKKADDLKKVKKERDEYLDGWKRAKADLINKIVYIE